MQLGDQLEIGGDGERRLGAECLGVEERPLEMHAQHLGTIGGGLGPGRGDAGEGPAQLVRRCRDGGRQQGGRALAGMKPRHRADGIGTIHDIGPAAAMHVQVDEAGHDQSSSRGVASGSIARIRLSWRSRP
ncbi:MAG: hypothetical protein R3D28_03425 [Geminicoccaceae bacterium]